MTGCVNNHSNQGSLRFVGRNLLGKSPEESAVRQARLKVIIRHFAEDRESSLNEGIK
jgi:hypothetical protein